MILAFLMAAALGATEPTVPTPPAPAPSGAVAERVPVSAPLKPGEKRIKMVCREETTTGTRFAKRVCYEQKDLEEREEESRRRFLESQMSPQMNH